jgi:hypothetical protein
MPFPDPAKVSSTDAEVITAFRVVRDELAKQIIELLAE